MRCLRCSSVLAWQGPEAGGEDRLQRGMLAAIVKVFRALPSDRLHVSSISHHLPTMGRSQWVAEMVMLCAQSEDFDTDCENPAHFTLLQSEDELK